MKLDFAKIVASTVGIEVTSVIIILSSIMIKYYDVGVCNDLYFKITMLQDNSYYICVKNRENH